MCVYYAQVSLVRHPRNARPSLAFFRGVCTGILLPRIKTAPALILAALVAVAFASIALAGTLQDATAAIQRGDYATAFKVLRPLSEHGDHLADDLLGGLYLEGKGVGQDYREAATWYRKAAEQGDAFGQFCIGDLYYSGQGEPQDYGKAMKWFQKSAAQGYAQAEERLGLLYYQGLAVRQDYEEAAKWFRKAAEQANPDAQIWLGYLYYSGQGIQKDYILADMWLILAAASHSGVSPEAMHERDSLAAKMTPAQIAEAQGRAAEWQPARAGK